MTASETTVYVVDDDPQASDWLGNLLRSHGFSVALFSCSEAFLRAYKPPRPSCLVFDLAMDQEPGPGLLAELRRQGSTIPIIILSRGTSVAVAVAAMKHGVREFFDKLTVEPDQVVAAVEAAIARDAELQRRGRAGAAFARRIQALTPREREIMDLLVGGRTNKMIAYDLGLSPKTVETHRTKVFQKMQVRSLVELTRAVLSHQLADRGRIH